MSLHEHRRYKILTREEEVEAWLAGDFNALVESVWPFVLKTAGRLARQDEAVFDELLSAAHVQLAYALKHYKPHHGVRFISYSCRFLYRRMLKVRSRFYKQQDIQMSELIGSTYKSPKVEIEDMLDGSELMTRLRDHCTELETEAMIRRVNGESLVEIAEVAGVSKQCIDQRIRKAIEKCQVFNKVS